MESKENKSKSFCERLGEKLSEKVVKPSCEGLRERIRKSRKFNPVDVYVGGRLKFKRMEKGLSQNALGNKLGLTFQQVQKYERGFNRIGGGRLYELSKILNVPVSYFFENYEFEDNFVKMINGGCGNGADSDFVLEKDVKALTKYFCVIKNRNLRKSVIDLVRDLNGDDKGEDL